MPGTLYSGLGYPGEYYPVVGSTAVSVSVTDVGAGRRLGKRRRQERIIVRLDGELIEVESVQELFRLLHSVKKDIPAVARQVAREFVETGKKVSEARREKSIQVVSVSQRDEKTVKDRIDEMDRYYWMMVSHAIEKLEQDDEDIFILMN